MQFCWAVTRHKQEQFGDQHPWKASLGLGSRRTLESLAGLGDSSATTPQSGTLPGHEVKDQGSPRSHLTWAHLEC